MGWRVVALALSIAAAADLISTEMALANPGAVELNPLAQEPWARIALQGGFVLLGSITLVLVHGWRPLLAQLLLAGVVSLKLTVAALNLCQ